MRWNLALALSVSLLLVGYASWTRFANTKKAPDALIAVDNQILTEDDYQDVLRDFLQPKTASSTTSDPGPLTNTDMVSRQLFAEFISLSSSGQANDATITSLVNKYVSSLPALNIPDTATFQDLKMVSDTKANFQNYAQTFTKIYAAYADRVMSIEAQAGNLETLGPEVYESASNFSAAYEKAASQLKGLPVPNALSRIHLELINTYLSSSVATEALSKTEEDSVAAFSGLIVFNKNLEIEREILREITRIINSHGV